MSDTPIRRCTECGSPQHLERRAIDYPESGVSNVQLLNVPIWICARGHEETEIPAVNELHDLLARLIVRKPARMTGEEIRFLRKRINMPAREFAERIGITAVQLSRIENGARLVTQRMDLLIRLAIAAFMAARDGKPFPDDMTRFIAKLEAWDIGSHRVRHRDQPLPDHEWDPEGDAPLSKHRELTR